MLQCALAAAVKYVHGFEQKKNNRKRYRSGSVLLLATLSYHYELENFLHILYIYLNYNLCHRWIIQHISNSCYTLLRNYTKLQHISLLCKHFFSRPFFVFFFFFYFRMYISRKKQAKPLRSISSSSSSNNGETTLLKFKKNCQVSTTISFVQSRKLRTYQFIIRKKYAVRHFVHTVSRDAPAEQSFIPQFIMCCYHSSLTFIVMTVIAIIIVIVVVSSNITSTLLQLL